MSTNFVNVDQISLGSPQYGMDLNNRLGIIDDNFKLLVNGSFLKGDKGDGIYVGSVSITNELSEYYLNGDLVNLWLKISEAIHKDHLTDFNSEWNTALEGMTIQVLYTEVMGENGIEKHIQSIFPFTYMDPRFVNMEYASEESHGNLIDHSCTVAMKSVPTEDVVVNEFVSYQNTPTIFWNSDIKNFCWKINGNQTDILCQGPAGKNGDSGSTYIAYVNSTETPLYVGSDIMVREILCVLGWYLDGDQYRYGQISPADFEEFGVRLETGLSIVAFPATRSNGVVERVSLEDQQIYYFSQVLKQSSSEGQKYFVYAGDSELCPGQMLEHTTLKEMLNEIGSGIDGSVKGLYVPIDKDDSNVIAGHMLWNSGKSLNISKVEDVNNPSPSDDKKSEMDVYYQNINLIPLGVIDGDIKIDSNLLGAENEDWGSTQWFKEPFSPAAFCYDDGEDYPGEFGQVELAGRGIYNYSSKEFPFIVVNNPEYEKNGDWQDTVYFYHINDFQYNNEEYNAWIKCGWDKSLGEWVPIQTNGGYCYLLTENIVSIEGQVTNSVLHLSKDHTDANFEDFNLKSDNIRVNNSDQLSVSTGECIITSGFSKIDSREIEISSGDSYIEMDGANINLAVGDTEINMTKDYIEIGDVIINKELDQSDTQEDESCTRVQVKGKLNVDDYSQFNDDVRVQGKLTVAQGDKSQTGSVQILEGEVELSEDGVPVVVNGDNQTELFAEETWKNVDYRQNHSNGYVDGKPVKAPFDVLNCSTIEELKASIFLPSSGGSMTMPGVTLEDANSVNIESLKKFARFPVTKWEPTGDTKKMSFSGHFTLFDWKKISGESPTTSFRLKFPTTMSIMFDLGIKQCQHNGNYMNITDAKWSTKVEVKYKRPDVDTTYTITNPEIDTFSVGQVIGKGITHSYAGKEQHDSFNSGVCDVVLDIPVCPNKKSIQINQDVLSSWGGGQVEVGDIIAVKVSLNWELELTKAGNKSFKEYLHHIKLLGLARSPFVFLSNVHIIGTYKSITQTTETLPSGYKFLNQVVSESSPGSYKWQFYYPSYVILSRLIKTQNNVLRSYLSRNSLIIGPDSKNFFFIIANDEKFNVGYSTGLGGVKSLHQISWDQK